MQHRHQLRATALQILSAVAAVSTFRIAVGWAVALLVLELAEHHVVRKGAIAANVDDYPVRASGRV
jgi:hypothetical protein